METKPTPGIKPPRFYRVGEGDKGPPNDAPPVFAPPYFYPGLAEDEREEQEEAVFLDSLKYVTDLEEARKLYDEWRSKRRAAKDS